MEFLYTDTRVEPEIMAGVLESIFPGFEIVFWDRMMQENDFNFDSADNLVFNIEFKEKKKEFGCTISIYRTPENHSQERALFIGRKLSAVLQKRVLVPYTSPAEPSNPCLNIIFENDKSYLADDNDTNFADGTTGKVTICGEHSVASYKFDQRANLVS